MNAHNGLSAWNKACELAVEIYVTINACSDRGFRENIIKSSLSIPSHIAQGYDRKSPQQYAHFLGIAEESCSELRTHLYIAAQLDLITLQKSTQLMQESLEISKVLKHLIDWCESRAESPFEKIERSSRKTLEA